MGKKLDFNVLGDPFDLVDEHEDFLINYVDNFRFLNGSVGWNLYNDSAAAPVDGDGGTAVSVLELSDLAADKVRGISLCFRKDAANRQGEGFSYSLKPIDPVDQGKVLKLDIEYKTSASYIDNNIQAYIYDVANSEIIEVSGNEFISSTLGGRFVGSFVCPVGSSDLRLIFHNTSSDILAWNFCISEVLVGPFKMTSSSSAITSDWVSFDPNCSWTNNVTTKANYARLGQTFIGQYSLSGTGTVGQAIPLTFDLPTGIQPDTSSLSTEGTGRFITVGTGEIVNTGVRTTPVTVFYSTLTNKLNIRYHSDANQSQGTPNPAVTIVTSTTGFNFSTGDYLTFDVKLPILGWETGVKPNEIITTRRNSVRANNNSGESLTPNVTAIPFSTITKNTFGDWNGTQFIPSETETYRFSGAIQFTAGLNGQVRAWVNNVLTKTAVLDEGSVVLFDVLLDLNAGDVVEFRTDVPKTLTAGNPHLHYIDIEKKTDGYTVVQPSEEVELIVTTDAGQVIPFGGSPTKVIFEDVQINNMDAYNPATGEFIAPFTKMYTVSATLWFGAVTNGVAYIELGIGGVFSGVRSEVNVSSVDRNSTSICRQVYLLKGQTLDVRVYQTTGAPGGAQPLITDGTVNSFEVRG